MGTKIPEYLQVNTTLTTTPTSGSTTTDTTQPQTSSGAALLGGTGNLFSTEAESTKKKKDKTTKNNQDSGLKIIGRSLARVPGTLASGTTKAIDDISDFGSDIKRLQAEKQVEKNPTSYYAAKALEQATAKQQEKASTHALGEKVQAMEERVAEARADIVNDNPDSKLAETLYKGGNLVEAIGYMAPTIAATAAATALTGGAGGLAAAGVAGSLATQAPGLALMGMGVYDQSLDDSLSQGYDYQTSSKKAFGDAAVEVGTEMLFGGIGGLGKGVASAAKKSIVAKTATSIAGSTAAEQAVKKVGVANALKLVGTAAAKTADFFEGEIGGKVWSLIGRATGEGVEEMISEVVGPYIERATTNPDADNATMGEILEAGLGGALIAFALSPLGNVNNQLQIIRQNRATAQRVENKSNSVDYQFSIADDVVNDIAASKEDLSIFAKKTGIDEGLAKERIYTNTAIRDAANFTIQEAKSQITNAATEEQQAEIMANMWSQLRGLAQQYADEKTLAKEAKNYEDNVRNSIISKEGNIATEQAKVKELQAKIAQANQASTDDMLNSDASAPATTNPELDQLRAELESAKKALDKKLQKAPELVDKSLMLDDAVAKYGQDAVNSFTAYQKYQDISKDRLVKKNANGVYSTYSRNDLAMEQFGGKTYQELDKKQKAQIDKQITDYGKALKAEVTKFIETQNENLEKRGFNTPLTIAAYTNYDDTLFASYLNNKILINLGKVHTVNAAQYVLSHEMLHAMLDQSGSIEARNQVFDRIEQAMNLIGFDKLVIEEIVKKQYTKMAKAEYKAKAEKAGLKGKEAEEYIATKVAGATDQTNIREEVCARFMQTAFGSKSVLEAMATTTPELLNEMENQLKKSAASFSDSSWDYVRLRIIDDINKAIATPKTAEENAKGIAEAQAKAMAELENDYDGRENIERSTGIDGRVIGESLESDEDTREERDFGEKLYRISGRTNDKQLNQQIRLAKEYSIDARAFSAEDFVREYGANDSDYGDIKALTNAGIPCFAYKGRIFFIDEVWQTLKKSDPAKYDKTIKTGALHEAGHVAIQTHRNSYKKLVEDVVNNWDSYFNTNAEGYIAQMNKYYAHVTDKHIDFSDYDGGVLGALKSGVITPKELSSMIEEFVANTMVMRLTTDSKLQDEYLKFFMHFCPGYMNFVRWLAENEYTYENGNYKARLELFAPDEYSTSPIITTRLPFYWGLLKSNNVEEDTYDKKYLNTGANVKNNRAQRGIYSSLGYLSALDQKTIESYYDRGASASDGSFEGDRARKFLADRGIAAGLLEDSEVFLYDANGKLDRIMGGQTRAMWKAEGNPAKHGLGAKIFLPASWEKYKAAMLDRYADQELISLADISQPLVMHELFHFMVDTNYAQMWQYVMKYADNTAKYFKTNSPGYRDMVEYFYDFYIPAEAKNALYNIGLLETRYKHIPTSSSITARPKSMRDATDAQWKWFNEAPEARYLRAYLFEEYLANTFGALFTSDAYKYAGIPQEVVPTIDEISVARIWDKICNLDFDHEMRLIWRRASTIDLSGTDTVKSNPWSDRAPILSDSIRKGMIELDTPLTENELQQYDELKAKYGETAYDSLPAKLNNSHRTSQFAGRVYASDEATDTLKTLLRREFLKGGLSFSITSDNKAMKDATNLFNARRNLSAAVDRAQEFMHVDPGKVGITYTQLTLKEVCQRIQELEAYNEQNPTNPKDLTEIYNMAMQLVGDLCAVAHRSGQNLQAFSLLKKLTPEGRLYYMEAQIDNLMKELAERRGDNAVMIVDKQGGSNVNGYRFVKDKKTGKYERIEIAPKLVQALLACKTFEEMELVEEEIIDNIAAQIPNTITDRVVAWRYLAMLGNPRTHLRNIFSNVVMGTTVKAKDVVGAVLEEGVSKWQANKGTDITYRTKTLNHFDKETRKQYKQFAVDDWTKDKMSEVALSGSKIGFQSRIEQARNKMGIPLLDKAAKGNSGLLEKEDDWSGKDAYVYAFVNYCEAQNISLDTLRGDTVADATVLAHARDYAITEAAKATYHDASDVATILNKLEKRGKVSQIIMGGLIPFKKTPINILKRGVEYSPIGLIKGAYDFVKAVNTEIEDYADPRLVGKLQNLLERKVITQEQYDEAVRGSNNFYAGDIAEAEDLSLIGKRFGAQDQRSVVIMNAIDKLASGLTGTGILLLGMLLGQLGLLKGSGKEEDRLEYYDEMLGSQKYSITIGGKNFTLDWMTPISMPLFVGAELAGLIKGTDEITFSDLIDSVGKLADPVMNLSVLQGINDAMSAYDSSLSKVIFSSVEGYAAQFIPTLAGQLARSIDPTRRTTYAPKDAGAGKELATFWNRMKNKIPGLSFTNGAYVDQWGRTETNSGDTFVGRLFNNSIAPWYTRDINVTEVDDYLTQLLAVTGDNTVIPATPEHSYTIDEEKYYLSSSEDQTTKQLVGQLSNLGVSTLMSTPGFADLTADEQADVVANVYTFAKKVAKADYALANNLPYTLDTGAQRIRDAVLLGVPLGEAIYINYVANNFTADKDANGKTISGSKKKKVINFYRTCGLSEEQIKAISIYDLD